MIVIEHSFILEINEKIHRKPKILFLLNKRLTRTHFRCIPLHIVLHVYEIQNEYGNS